MSGQKPRLAEAGLFPTPRSEIAELARIATAGVLPEAIRRSRRLADALGASSFALFFTGRGPAAMRLIPCFDQDFPGTSAVTTQLTDAGGNFLGRHAAASACPCWWRGAGDGDELRHAMFTTLPSLTPERGVALPVWSDGAKGGLFVFTGEALQFGQEAIFALHEECLEIFAAVAAQKTSSGSGVAPITKRELECLRLTAAGRTSEDIARILGLSVHTANQYLTSTALKLDAVNRMHAVAKAMRLGLID
jgi:DNA-binding CsgD family transcriptional regulator